MHALRYANDGKVGAGAGNKGGISEYARQAGFSQPYITMLKNAAKVYTYINNNSTYNFLEKTQHLSEIHAAPKEAWVPLVEYLFSEEGCEQSTSCLFPAEFMKSVSENQNHITTSNQLPIYSQNLPKQFQKTKMANLAILTHQLTTSGSSRTSQIKSIISN